MHAYVCVTDVEWPIAPNQLALAYKPSISITKQCLHLDRCQDRASAATLYFMRSNHLAFVVRLAISSLQWAELAYSSIELSGPSKASSRNFRGHLDKVPRGVKRVVHVHVPWMLRPVPRTLVLEWMRPNRSISSDCINGSHSRSCRTIVSGFEIRFS